MRNMARKDTLATPCILLRERLIWGGQRKKGVKSEELDF